MISRTSGPPKEDDREDSFPTSAPTSGPTFLSYGPFTGNGSDGGSGTRCLQTYRFMAIAGRSYTISTCDSFSGDPYLVVSGVCACNNDDSCGLGSACTCVASFTGIATVCASSYSDMSATWSYTLTDNGVL